MHQTPTPEQISRKVEPKVPIMILAESGTINGNSLQSKINAIQSQQQRGGVHKIGSPQPQFNKNPITQQVNPNGTQQPIMVVSRQQIAQSLQQNHNSTLRLTSPKTISTANTSSRDLDQRFGSKTVRHASSSKTPIAVTQINLQSAKSSRSPALIQKNSISAEILSSSSSSCSSQRTLRQSIVIDALKLKEMQTENERMNNNVSQITVLENTNDIIKLRVASDKILVRKGLDQQEGIQTQDWQILFHGHMDTTHEKEISFAKCSSEEQVNQALFQIYENSPFKKGALIFGKIENQNVIQKDFNHAQKGVLSSQVKERLQLLTQHSEDVQETIDIQSLPKHQQSLSESSNHDQREQKLVNTTIVYNGQNKASSVVDNNDYDSMKQVKPQDLNRNVAIQNYQTVNPSINQRESVEFGDNGASNGLQIINVNQQIIDVSLNKSHMTMEDNNKAHKKRSLSRQDIQHPQPIIKQQVYENERDIQMDQEEEHKEESLGEAMQSEAKLLEVLNNNEQEKNIDGFGQHVDQINEELMQQQVFELIADTATTNHQPIDSSFETMTSADNINYLVTQSEELAISHRNLPQQISSQKIKSNANLTEQEDSIIENEVKKISNNVNTLTVEHLNLLREHIQKLGFHDAAQQAKKDFNLITSESNNTGLSSQSEVCKDEQQELLMTVTGGGPKLSEREMVLKNEGHICQATTASKQLNANHSNSISNREEQKAIDSHLNRSKLIRKVVICELQQNDNCESKIVVSNSIPTTGLSCTPQILYSDKDSEVKAYIEKSNENSENILVKFLTPKILKQFLKLQLKQISCGFEHCLALTECGQIYSWGCGASGCLGHGNYLSYSEPMVISNGEFQKIVRIECGGYHNAAINCDGQLYMWGRSDVGQLGIPKEETIIDEKGFCVLIPTQIKHFQQNSIQDVALGEAHSIVLDTKGQVYSFGWGDLGQLGMQLDCLGDNFKIHQIEVFKLKPAK